MSKRLITKKSLAYFKKHPRIKEVIEHTNYVELITDDIILKAVGDNLMAGIQKDTNLGSYRITIPKHSRFVGNVNFTVGGSITRVDGQFPRFLKKELKGIHAVYYDIDYRAHHPHIYRDHVCWGGYFIAANRLYEEDPAGFLEMCLDFLQHCEPGGMQNKGVNFGHRKDYYPH